MTFILQSTQITIPAGAVRPLSIAGDFFFCTASNQDQFKIQFDDKPRCDFERGLGVENAPYNEVTIINNNSTDLIASFSYGASGDRGGRFVDTRNVPIGALSILGSVGVQGQPLVKDGGSAKSVGESFYNSLNDASAAGFVVEVLAPASNVNGVFINRFEGIDLYDSANGGLLQITGSRSAQFCLLGQGAGNVHIENVYLPAGAGITVSNNIGSYIKWAGNWDLI